MPIIFNHIIYQLKYFQIIFVFCLINFDCASHFELLRCEDVQFPPLNQSISCVSVSDFHYVCEIMFLISVDYTYWQQYKFFTQLFCSLFISTTSTITTKINPTNSINWKGYTSSIYINFITFNATVHHEMFHFTFELWFNSNEWWLSFYTLILTHHLVHNFLIFVQISSVPKKQYTFRLTPSEKYVIETQKEWSE